MGAIDGHDHLSPGWYYPPGEGGPWRPVLKWVTLTAKLHLGDTVSMNIYREIVNVHGMRKVNTAKRH